MRQAQKTHSRNSQNRTQNQAGRGVRAAYTWCRVKDTVTALLRSKSLRRVAAELGLRNHSVVQRIRDGIEPRDPQTRAALGLPELGAAQICRVHGVAHGKQCRPRPTPEQNAADYADWLDAHAREIAEAVTWASGR